MLSGLQNEFELPARGHIVPLSVTAVIGCYCRIVRLFNINWKLHTSKISRGNDLWGCKLWGRFVLSLNFE